MDRDGGEGQRHRGGRDKVIKWARRIGGCP